MIIEFAGLTAMGRVAGDGVNCRTTEIINLQWPVSFGIFLYGMFALREATTVSCSHRSQLSSSHRQLIMPHISLGHRTY